jgi:hypothetical protein
VLLVKSIQQSKTIALQYGPLRKQQQGQGVNVILHRTSKHSWPPSNIEVLRELIDTMAENMIYHEL